MKIPMAVLALIGCSLISGCDVSNGTARSSTQGSQSPDPVVVDAPIAYVERPLPRTKTGDLKADDLLNPGDFNPGAKLILKARASATAEEVAITEAIFPPIVNPDGTSTPQAYDVKDPSPSRDGSKILFSLRAPAIKNVPDDQQPTWDIWEYDRTTKTARAIITNSETAAAGQDVQPAYLADGRIVFSSDRQSTTTKQNRDAFRPAYKGQAEDNSRAAFNLHIVDSDGGNLHQITFNPSHDLQPTVMNSGEILFLRWDRFGHDNLSLYTINPDGTGLSFYYGYHSQNTGTVNPADAKDSQAVFAKAQMMDDNRVLVSLRPRTTLQQGGDLVAIETANFFENDRSLISDNTELRAQTSLTNSSVYTHGKIVDNKASPGGYFNSAAPMNDDSGRLLASWSACRVINPATQEPRPCTERFTGAEQADPSYALWMYNSRTQTQLPVKIPALGVQLEEPVLLTSRPLLPSPPLQVDEELARHKEAILHIQNVNDLRLTPYRGAAYVRLVKAIPLPSREDLELVDGAFGSGGRAVGMREIVAYAPLETDGSVKLKVPAEVPLMLDVVDAKGQRLGPQHKNWLSLAAGETRDCKGCHEAGNKNSPHGRLAAEPLGTASDIAADKPVQTPSLDLLAANLRYNNIVAKLTYPGDSRCLTNLPSSPKAWKLPIAETCLTNWSASCAININYLEQIQPLWEADRRTCDDTGLVQKDDTCTSCHNRSSEYLSTLDTAKSDALKALNVQLELRGVKRASTDRHVISYRELFEASNLEEYPENGDSKEVLVIETTEQINEDGTITLVETTKTVPNPKGQPLNTQGARSTTNAEFFKLFTTPNTRHYQMLSADELRLIAEWLDMGAQYYNEPSKARKEN